jgi:hypothetical protein
MIRPSLQVPIVNAVLDARPVYTIDAADRIVFANSAWVEFARFESGMDLSQSSVLGRSIWDLARGLPVRHLWQVLYGRVRAARAPIFVPMRVDTPSLRRLIDIEVRPLAERSVQHICERVWTEARPAVALLDACYPRDERALRSCHWCCRIQVRLGHWEEIEIATRSLGIEAGASLPVVQAAACPTCKQSLLKTFPARVA